MFSLYYIPVELLKSYSRQLFFSKTSTRSRIAAEKEKWLKTQRE